MRLALILSSPLGWPVWQQLRAAGVVASVAVPITGQAETEELTQALQQMGQPTIRLHRATLAADLAGWLAEVAPVAVLVLTFPWRIPAAVLEVPLHGFLNFHFAALPAYRGPEPLFWQIRNGETAGAVTVHRMTADFDTGPVVLAMPVPIGPHDTHGLHRAQLAAVGAGVAQQLLNILQLPAPLPGQEQNPAEARYWPRPTLADLCIRWTESALAIDRLVRAANPWNRGALATLRQQPLRVLSTSVAAPTDTVAARPGTIMHTDASTGLLVACGDGSLLRLDIVALDEGYFTGLQLAAMGVPAGEVLGELPMAVPASSLLN